MSYDHQGDKTYYCQGDVHLFHVYEKSALKIKEVEHHAEDIVPSLCGNGSTTKDCFDIGDKVINVSLVNLLTFEELLDTHIKF
jgi:hypothetical protein